MSDTLRAAMALGVLAASAYLLVRAIRSQDISGGDVVEAVGMALTSTFVPGAIEMLLKAFGRAELPIFNGLEDRISLTVGGTMLIITFLYCNFTALRRAWTNRR